MGQSLVTALVTIVTAIVGVAIIAVLVSKNANTSGVIQAGSGGLSQLLSVAEAPVTGSTNGSQLGFGYNPTASLGGYGTTI